MQALEDGEIFDPDFFLKQFQNNGHPYHLVLLKPLQNPPGTRHHRPEGAARDPVLLLSASERYFTKEKDCKCLVQNCFVSRGVDNIEYYL